MDIRSYFNSFKNSDFVEGISEASLQYGYINSLNLFDTRSTSQTAIIFDKDYATTTLLPQVNRGDKAATQGKERTADTFALKLAYFKHADRLTSDDIQGWRVPGSTDNESIARATGEKMLDMRRTWDQTQEYMKLQALKGIFKTPDGVVVANMFTEFGVSQQTVDFVLGTSTTNIDAKIREMKTKMAKAMINGGSMTGVQVMVDPEFFDKLISHPNMKNAYQYYMNSGKQVLRDDLSRYMAYGIQDVFEHRGVTFVSYDATFNLPDGTTELAFGASTGLALPTGVRGLFRGYTGPSAKLSEANQPGQELFVRTYLDERDEWVEFELEASPLYFSTAPRTSIAISSSN